MKKENNSLKEKLEDAKSNDDQEQELALEELRNKNEQFQETIADLQKEVKTKEDTITNLENKHVTPVTQKEKRVMMELLQSIVDDLDFQDHKKDTQLITWKQVFEKSMMSKREAMVILGLLRKIDQQLGMSK